VRYALMKIMSRIVCTFSDVLSYKLGDWIGSLCWLIMPRRRRNMAVENVMACLGVDRGDATAIARQSTLRLGRMSLEVLRVPKIKVDPQRYVKIEGREHLEDALAYGRGVVLATAHSGNWELMGGALALEGFPIISVAQKQTNAEMDRFFNEYRALVGVRIVYKQGVHTILRLFREKMAIGFIMDQRAGSNGVVVNFFGRPTSTPPGAAAFARMQNAPIIPIFITETSKGKHTVIISAPIWMQKTADREYDILTTTQKLSDIIEQHIRTYPHEWFWLHNRWKHQPKVTINQLEQTVV
jgi:Kdo2-lipid IVA lauroyltransferase/acyltransferase